MTENPQRKIYQQRSYTTQPRSSDPARNLCADILLQAMEDVQPKRELKDLPGKTSIYAKDLLSFHRKAAYYFSVNNHTFLCEVLDLDPEQVKIRAMIGMVRYHYKT